MFTTSYMYMHTCVRAVTYSYIYADGYVNAPCIYSIVIAVLEVIVNNICTAGVVHSVDCLAKDVRIHVGACVHLYFTRVCLAHRQPQGRASFFLLCNIMEQ